MLKKTYPQNEVGLPLPQVLSVGVMILGAIVAGYGDLTFDLPGYALTTLNCVVTAGPSPTDRSLPCLHSLQVQRNRPQHLGHDVLQQPPLHPPCVCPRHADRMARSEDLS